MGLTLAEYAALHPQQEPQQEQQARRNYQDAQRERERIDQLKASIAQQLQEGNEPQYILYSALQAIGLLTHDPEWAEAGTRQLDSIYADLAQQSMLTDTAAAAAHRLEAMQTQYNDRLRRQLTRQLSGYRRIEKALQEALQAVDAIEPQNQ